MDNDKPSAPPNTSGKKILCVEDEHFISELYSRALTKAGYEVTTVFDGLEGLKAAQSDQFDLVLLDIMIPSLKGTEILRRLRDNRETPNFRGKIIITTNLDQGDETRAEVEKLADGYIIKANVTPKELVTFLDQVN
jgi:CheY-like chemotaxis protein